MGPATRGIEAIEVEIVRQRMKMTGVIVDAIAAQGYEAAHVAYVVSEYDRAKSVE